MESFIELKNLVLLLLITLSGILIIVGCRRTGIGLFISVIVISIRGPFLSSLINSFTHSLPQEFYPYRFFIIFFLIVIAVFVFLMRSQFIREIIRSFIVHVTTDVLYAIFSAPVKACERLIRRIRRRNHL